MFKERLLKTAWIMEIHIEGPRGMFRVPSRGLSESDSRNVPTMHDPLQTRPASRASVDKQVALTKSNTDF
jgi:hypothetical protein